MAQNPMPSDTANSDTANPSDDEVLRKRLLSRIAVAGVVIVGLLGGLAVFDSLNKPQPPALPKMAAAPVEPEPKAGDARPTDAKPVEEPKADEKAVADSAPAVPERTDTPLVPPAEEKPAKPAKAATPPAVARPAAVKPTPTVATPTRPEAKQEIARVMPERSQTAHAPAPRPLSQAVETARRFLVQVGVFSNHANAEELVAKLQQAGIPAQIESRVQVGPFASRVEADAARSKLKAMGIDDGILVRR